METDIKSLAERLRSLDESGERYQDANWNLESQIHDFEAKEKEATDREIRLTQHLNILQAEKSAVQKDLDDIKSNYAKLSDDHVAALKQCDIEMGNLKRNLNIMESEKSTLHRQNEELLNQNKELATAIVQHRGRLEDLEQSQGLVQENLEIVPDDLTPEHSPPPSPVKGTPRHTMLESETLKSSLQHAHRMIQNLKSNIQREKAEKLDLKRLLQDARDELEIRRRDIGTTVNRKPRKPESRDTKKHLRISHLGGPRSSTREIHNEDPNWEDDDSEPKSPSPGIQKFTKTMIHSPRQSNSGRSTSFVHVRTGTSESIMSSNEQETVEAFETAPERLSGEGRSYISQKDGFKNVIESEDRPHSLMSLRTNQYLLSPGTRLSFQSTASTSDDDFETCYRGKLNGNTSQPSRLRLRVGHGGYRRSRISSIDSQSYASPGSVTNTSRDGTPNDMGKSLFAELGNMCVTDEELTLESPPLSKQTSRSTTPVLRPTSISTSIPPIPLAKLPSTTDSAIITGPWESDYAAKKTPTNDTYNFGSTSEPAGTLILPIQSQESKATQTYLDIQMKHASSQWDDEYDFMNFSRLNSRPQSLCVSNFNNTLHNLEISSPIEKPSTFSLPLTSGSFTSEGDSKNMQEPKKLDLTGPSVISQTLEPFISVTEPIPEDCSENFTQVRPEYIVLSDVQASEIEPLQSHCNQASPITHLQRFSRKDIYSHISRIQPLNKDNFNLDDQKNCNPTPIVGSKDHQNDNYSRFELMNVQQPFSNSADQLQKFASNIIQTIDECSQTSLTGSQIDELLKTQKSLSVLDHNDELSSSDVSRSTHKRSLQLGDNMKITDQMTTTITSEFESFANLSTEISNSDSLTNSTTPGQPLKTITSNEFRAATLTNLDPSIGGAGMLTHSTHPISTYKSNLARRPLTPNISIPFSCSHSDETTPRPINSQGFATKQSSTRNLRSRVSSISSFASEIENRFQIHHKFGISAGFPTGTDPRMISAITQTMIGDYLWKYTRKTGRGVMSEKRHRRYFWVHPYTKTLYWSDRDPSLAGRAELKAKSVPIEAVRVVTDDNPMPPGLHRKSLIILTPSRAVKFTATTGQLHETWFNSLSYLLLRTGGEKLDMPPEISSEPITLQDMVEFHPGFTKNNQAGIASLSSFQSRTTRNEYLKKTPYTLNSKSPRTSAGTTSRFGNYWKPGKDGLIGSVTSRHSRYGQEKVENLYQSNQVHSSAEDLREMIEEKDRDSDKLENVRACCDGISPGEKLYLIIMLILNTGRHDVGHLSNSTKSRNCRNIGATYSSRHDCPGVRFDTRTKR